MFLGPSMRGSEYLFSPLRIQWPAGLLESRFQSRLLCICYTIGICIFTLPLESLWRRKKESFRREVSSQFSTRRCVNASTRSRPVRIPLERLPSINVISKGVPFPDSNVHTRVCRGWVYRPTRLYGPRNTPIFRPLTLVRASHASFP